MLQFVIGRRYITRTYPNIDARLHETGHSRGGKEVQDVVGAGQWRVGDVEWECPCTQHSEEKLEDEGEGGRHGQRLGHADVDALAY